MSQKTAIVTGASSGIGLGIVKTLLAKNYRVVAGSRNLAAAKVLKASDQCFLVDGDVADKATGAKLAEVAMNKTGRIDLLVNNAGIFTPGNFHEYGEEQYRATMATNADGFFYVTQAVVRHMLKQKQGHVVSISTTLATQPVAGRAGRRRPDYVHSRTDNPEAHAFICGNRSSAHWFSALVGFSGTST